MKEREREVTLDQEELIREDQSLTDEERKTKRHENNVLRMKRSINRLQKLIDLNAPKIILANEVMILFSAAWSLWEGEMRSACGSMMQRFFRQEFARCIMCSADLPMPFNEEGICATCLKQLNSLEEDQ